MKKNNFIKTIFAFALLFVASQSKAQFVINDTTFQNNDAFLIDKSVQQVKAAVIEHGGGGSSTRQSTQDSILKAIDDLNNNLNYLNGSYYSSNSMLGRIDDNTSGSGVFYVLTYTNVSTPGTQTITAGTKQLSICNVGTTTATVNGNVIVPGQSLNWQATWHGVLGQIVYNAMSSTLSIIYSR